MTRPRAAVWGLGRFGGGLGAARELLRTGYELRILDRLDRAALAPSLRVLEHEAGPVEVLPEDPASLEDIELLCVNPGVPPTHRLLAEAVERGIRLTQELDLFLEAYPGQVIAVTGTNGKSSTATMLARALDAVLDQPALVGGNLGGSLFDRRHRWSDTQHCVLEISSFQASRLHLEARPFRALAITNLGSDHLDWHGDLRAYHAAKLRLLDGVDQDGPCLASSAETTDPRLHILAPDDEPARRGDRLYVGDRCILEGGWIRARGRFQLDNARLVLALVQRLGFDVSAAAHGLRGFRGLPHRLAYVGERRGVAFYDNAVSTGVASTCSALETLRKDAPHTRIHWIAGGRSKGQDLQEHVTRCAPLASSIYVFGEVASSFGLKLKAAGHDVRIHESLRSALRDAFRAARNGDPLLFSPAFASFDQYANFEARARDALSWWHSMGSVSAEIGADS